MLVEQEIRDGLSVVFQIVREIRPWAASFPELQFAGVVSHRRFSRILPCAAY
jgi:hypothetical protein